MPLTTLRWLGTNLPASGGAYFRIFPYAVTNSAFGDCERRGVPGTFYVHPWEVDPSQPRLDVPFSSRLRHYTGLHRTAGRLDRLLRERAFGTVREALS